ncbi:hypothetical protein SISSUDRAFT_991230, partial [Sistotremastrum suecicum HHB10207 ss-3]
IQEAVDEAVAWAAKSKGPPGDIIHCARVGTAAKVTYQGGHSCMISLSDDPG